VSTFISFYKDDILPVYPRLYLFCRQTVSIILDFFWFSDSHCLPEHCSLNISFLSNIISLISHTLTIARSLGAFSLIACSLTACSLTACSLTACSLTACSLTACSLTACSLTACSLTAYSSSVYSSTAYSPNCPFLTACPLAA
jgi:hypothetical protein